MEIYGNETKSIMESPLKYQRSNVMKKQNVETIVLKNAKTGVAEKIQHECHNTGYGTKHFWKADAKFFELLSNFSAAESKVLAYILQETQPTKNKFVGAYKTIARKLNCDVVTVRNTVKKIDPVAPEVLQHGAAGNAVLGGYLTDNLIAVGLIIDTGILQQRRNQVELAIAPLALAVGDVLVQNENRVCFGRDGL